MLLYTQEGKIARGKNPKNSYYYRGGKLTSMPTSTDSKEKIFDFLETCMGELKPNITRKDILEYWNFYLGKHAMIISYLEALLAKHTAEGDKVRVTAYRNAIRAIKNSKVPIASGAQAIKLKGIGAKTAAKIDEILSSGGLEMVDTRMKDEIKVQKNLELFMSIWGIGAKNARSLYNKGYRTLQDLENAPPEKEITAHVKLGLKYHADFLERIPRKNIDYIKPKLEKILYKIDPEAKFCIAGSYRRGFKSSGDIDIIISSNKPSVLLKEYIRKLHGAGILMENLAVGLKKYEGIGLLKGKYIRIDILSVNPSEFGTALLYFSSGFDFNKMIRNIAKDKGWTLSESGMKNIQTGKILKFETEEDVFQKLKMKYIPPRERL